jgi:hypothetical protein
MDTACRLSYASLFVVGVCIAAAVVAARLESPLWLVVSALMVGTSGVTAIGTSFRSGRVSTTYLAGIVVGLCGVGFGVFWALGHSSEPEVFSPTLIGYVGDCPHFG